MQMISQTAVLVFLGALVCTANGKGEFLAARRKFNSADVQTELNGIMHEVLGQGHGVDDARLKKIHKTLDPLFHSLPRNKRGHISGAVMRYAVQRYFSQKRGWIMKGFHGYEEDANTSAVGADIMQHKLPGYIRSVLEDRFAIDGFSLDGVVAMIASLEQLALDEVIRGVEVAFYLNSYDFYQVLSKNDLTEILCSFLITEMLEGTDDKEKHQRLRRQIHKRYPHWDTTFLFLQDNVGNDVFQQKSSVNPFRDPTYSFEDAVRIAQQVTEAFGSWSNHECHEMKDMLLEMDIHSTGRVKLSDFYSYSKDGAWQFLEPSEQLRQAGALDESSEWLGPQVMIPNYINSMSNCITSTPYYSICCLNECDLVFQQLESHVAAPSTTPSEIIGALESGIYAAANISKLQSARLAEIASVNDGQIPIYGRLFARWLHFVYPQECPYPHADGVVKMMTQKQWKELVGAKSESATKDEIAQHLESDFARRAPSEYAGTDMWNLEENLLDSSTPSDSIPSIWGHLRIFAQLGMLTGLFALLRPLVQTLRKDKKREEYSV